MWPHRGILGELPDVAEPQFPPLYVGIANPPVAVCSSVHWPYLEDLSGPTPVVSHSVGLGRAPRICISNHRIKVIHLRQLTKSPPRIRTKWINVGEQSTEMMPTTAAWQVGRERSGRARLPLEDVLGGKPVSIRSSGLVVQYHTAVTGHASTSPRLSRGLPCSTYI